MKQKTHSGAKKRFKKTGSGKIQRRKAAARHLLHQKSSKQTKQQSTAMGIAKADHKVVSAMLA